MAIPGKVYAVCGMRLHGEEGARPFSCQVLECLASGEEAVAALARYVEHGKGLSYAVLAVRPGGIDVVTAVWDARMLRLQARYRDDMASTIRLADAWALMHAAAECAMWDDVSGTVDLQPESETEADGLIRALKAREAERMKKHGLSG
jgi:hypothetical protein